MKQCSACGKTHEVVDVGDEGEPELLCKFCIMQNVEDFLDEPVNDLDLTPFEVKESG